MVPEAASRLHVLALWVWSLYAGWWAVAGRAGESGFGDLAFRQWGGRWSKALGAPAWGKGVWDHAPFTRGNGLPVIEGHKRPRGDHPCSQILHVIKHRSCYDHGQGLGTQENDHIVSRVVRNGHMRSRSVTSISWIHDSHAFTCAGLGHARSQHPKLDQMAITVNWRQGVHAHSRAITDLWWRIHVRGRAMTYCDHMYACGP